MTEIRIPLNEDEHRKLILIKESLGLTWHDLIIEAVQKLGQPDTESTLNNIEKNIELLKSQAKGDKVAMLDLAKILLRLIVNDNYVKAYNVVVKLNEYVRKQLEISNIGGGHNE